MKKIITSYFFMLLIVVFLLRFGLLLVQPATFLDDPDDYQRLAINLNEYGVFGDKNNPTAFRPPLYPLILAGTFQALAVHDYRGNAESSLQRFILPRPLAIAWLHAGLGMFTALLVFATGIKIGMKESMAFLAAILVVVDPVLLQQSRLVMTETFATFFSILLIYLLIVWSEKLSGYRQYWFVTGIGILFGLAVLCRPAFLVFAALVAVAILLSRNDHRIATVSSLCFVLGCAVPLTFWTVRNERQFDRPVITTTHGGYTLLLANNRFLYDHLQKHWPWEQAWDAQEFHKWYTNTVSEKIREEKASNKPIRNELLQDEIARDLAWEEIKKRPGMFAQSTLVRFGNLWQCLPYGTGSAKQISFWIRIAIAAFYACELYLAITGLVCLVRNRKRKTDTSPQAYSPWLWGILLMISVQLPHLIYWTNMRMRAPLVPVLALLVVYALTQYHRRQLSSTSWES
ncbi:MAG: phospholipid carrier-dependent glycosyltransferase [Thermoguttaceae bacterium]|nr:phospholipid carrier-dependent glycosyltransferase [Thermoguttaceae bacterium]